MEAAEPIIKLNTPESIKDESKIYFITQLIIKKEKEDYILKFGTKVNDLIIKVINENSKNIFYYQKSYSKSELKNISMIFSFYSSINDIISFLKVLKYDIEEKEDFLIIKFNVYMPNGEPKLIELNLQKILRNSNDLINYLLEEINSMKININKIETNTKTEIENLKKDNIKLQKEVEELKDQNKKLLEKNNKLILLNEDKYKIYIDSKIIESVNSINHIIEYIKESDKSFNFKEMKLLYRGSRDGDRTKKCHELCDNKKNVLILIQSDTGYMFGGYSKIGFKTNNKFDHWKIDNNCFLFSVNLKKNIYCN